MRIFRPALVTVHKPTTTIDTTFVVPNERMQLMHTNIGTAGHMTRSALHRADPLLLVLCFKFIHGGYLWPPVTRSGCSDTRATQGNWGKARAHQPLLKGKGESKRWPFYSSGPGTPPDHPPYPHTRAPPTPKPVRPLSRHASGGRDPPSVSLPIEPATDDVRSSIPNSTAVTGLVQELVPGTSYHPRRVLLLDNGKAVVVLLSTVLFPCCNCKPAFCHPTIPLQSMFGTELLYDEDSGLS
ncbi:hypothetical protein MIND_00187000 [Mycena indigotica]|uniref:Uncharacterized protein n=1 Tax=Mycena indigotica TaxID=2126181 RepID=A0A8H6T6C9_9AGAR|nr:uncharacterized protein MIND_00187000 [Mycena indigotica]KAF7311766.1 hypothetical protein MIND_00187000 [Mycena indigotica]